MKALEHKWTSPGYVPYLSLVYKLVLTTLVLLLGGIHYKSQEKFAQALKYFFCQPTDIRYDNNTINLYDC